MEQQQHKLKINLFGELWKLSLLKLEEDDLKVLEFFASKHQIPKTEALLDISLYQETWFKKIESYEGFPQTSISGLIDTPRNQIEIWFAKKKIKKYRIAELNNESLLFPLYQVENTDLDFGDLQQGLYVEQTETGLIGSYELLLPNFSIDKLSFQFMTLFKMHTQFRFLHTIKYDGIPVPKKQKPDSVMRSQYAFEI